MESQIKYNHLFLAEDRSAVYYMDKDCKIMGVAVPKDGLSMLASQVRVLAEPTNLPDQCRFPEEPSMAITDMVRTDTSAMRAFVCSDGHGRMSIFGQFGEDPIADLTPLVASLHPHSGQPFVVLDAILSSSGQISVLTRCIQEEIIGDNSTPTFSSRSQVQFVSENMDMDHSDDDPRSPSSTASAADEKELNFRHPARLHRRKQTSFHVSYLKFAPKGRSSILADPTNADLYEMILDDSFVCAKDILAAVIRQSNSTDCFMLASNSRPQTAEEWRNRQYSGPISAQEPSSAASDAMDIDEEAGDMDADLLASVQGRLAAYTSDKVVDNPLGTWEPAPSLLRDEDSLISSSFKTLNTGDDEETSPVESDDSGGIFFFQKDSNDFKWNMKSEISFASHPVLFAQRNHENSSRSLNVALGIDVHARIFNISIQNIDASPSLVAEEAAAFEAINFVQQGKRGKKFLLASPSQNNLALIEHSRFIYLYRKINTLPSMTPQPPPHKAAHQLIEKVGVQFIGAQWVTDNRLVALGEDQLLEFLLV
jgi:hypothetical protein